MTFVEWQTAKMNDGHAHMWRTVLGTTVERGATYCAICQIERD